MRRPKYSEMGSARALMMTRTRLAVYVEGEPDSYVYSKVMRAVCESLLDYRLILPHELPAGYEGEGKESLKKWYRFLRRKGQLRTQSRQHTTNCLFVLDKDIDDLLGTRCRSEHVVYTEFYDIENTLFRHGNLLEAICATLSCDHHKAGKLLAGSQQQWLDWAAALWKDWVKIAVFAKTVRANYQAFAIWSKVNPTPSGPVHNDALQTELKTLSERVGTLSASFRDSYDAQAKRIDKVYRDGDHDRVFKGKWYACILEDHIRQKGHNIRRSVYFRESIVKHLAHSLNATDGWADFVRQPARRLLAGEHGERG